MAKVTIKRRTDSKRADGRGSLYAVLNIQRAKIRIPLDISVTANEWEPIKERVKGRSREAEDFNLIISATKAKISDILVRMRLSGESLTKERFLELYRHPGETMNFNDYAAGHLAEIAPSMQPETIRHHKSVLDKVKSYAPRLQLADITVDWLRIYAVHLRDFHHNCPGTVQKNMCVIRLHYQAAVRAGKIATDPFEIYKIPQASKPAVIFLTEDELTALTALFRSDTLNDNEQDALRFFLFMTFTGMHITDARLLQIEQIFGGEIHYIRIKTRTKVSVPVSAPAAKLIEYYKGGYHHGNLFRGLPTDQAFNRLIKRVCERVGITKAVSAKAARHTFATIYYRKNGGDLGTLSKLLGHTSINTTMIYAHIMKDNRVKGVSAFDGML